MNPKGSSNGAGSNSGSNRNSKGGNGRSGSRSNNQQQHQDSEVDDEMMELMDDSSEDEDEDANENNEDNKDDAGEMDDQQDGQAKVKVRSGDAESSEDDDEEEDDEEEEEEEDSSDMDAEECDKKRTEFVEELGEMEKQFSLLREQLYRERITQIDAKLEEVKAGKAAEYLQPLEELQVNMKNRLEVGDVLRQLRMANINCKHQAEKIATEQNLASEKELLYDSIKHDLEEKIHMLEEDKHNVDFNSGLWEQHDRSKRRKADPLDPDRRKKPVTVSGPFMVYMLPESDILDDWTSIKKALAQQRKKT